VNARSVFLRSAAVKAGGSRPPEIIRERPHLGNVVVSHIAPDACSGASRGARMAQLAHHRSGRKLARAIASGTCGRAP
jgi:hypothetical protein